MDEYDYDDDVFDYEAGDAEDYEGLDEADAAFSDGEEENDVSDDDDEEAASRWVVKPAFLGDYDAFTAMFDAALAARVPLDTLIDIHDAMAEHGVKHFFDLGLAANFTSEDDATTLRAWAQDRPGYDEQVNIIN
ncbi:Hypothetical protein, putative [Bodo saltans]|uniref:Uncharacterized protein n=1 Tax=Bodo saltans TaxID=75058 RepID=A0A0S4JNS9_BODSA|nr:Hypothetical protein, putative [Bodo saltans]|eukprot:CUG93216.1 Hypothetical protein, putative [Bodo saltans]